MLTREQIKNLKPGDTVLVKATVIYKDQASFAGSIGAYGTAWGYNEVYPLLTPPKHDPCRPFKTGDKAKLRVINGRKNQKLPEDVIFTVVGDEDDYGAVPIEYISVRGMLTSTTVMAVWLELVTPVEERSPYYVKETASVYEVFNRNENNSSVAIFFKSQYSIEKAKERAEAECDRLNAEYRKEQK